VLVATREALVARLSQYSSVVEVGVGARPEVAESLAKQGVDVTVTDLDDRPVSPAVRFVVDDVTDPTLAVYADADAIYALNLPPELHRPVVGVARRVGAACLFTTLGADQPEVAVRRATLPGETLYLAADVR